MKRDKMLHFVSVKPIKDPTYEELDEISRCVHFDDFENAVRKKYLAPQSLINSHRHLQRQVLWFAPSQSSSEHNFYGNVSFTIKWETVLEKLGPNLYLLDQAVYNDRSFTRVLVTKNNYDGKLKKVRLNSNDTPMTKSDSGFRHVSYCENNERGGPHELQIAIEVDAADAKWLYSECKVSSNNHSDVNSLHSGHNARNSGTISNFESFKCFKFNTAQKCQCPYPWTQDQCEERTRALLRPVYPAQNSRRDQVRSAPAPLQTGRTRPAMTNSSRTLAIRGRIGRTWRWRRTLSRRNVRMLQ
ncbi:uncharacterized protein LOC108680413 [Hyalella azteca]|uniref:Uncharacterized protein LOC108680413 n=1 Tax=Hyalella azteca TaxID=294128 RepID=A0A8B7PHB3_HYAAZ|nr:uncharacterized protein LOC108680413 [Hyalella azteca]